LGHVIRIDETRDAKKICECNSDEKRIAGRPRFRWLEDVENDIRELV
jgi:hypothetical protein